MSNSWFTVVGGCAGAVLGSGLTYWYLQSQTAPTTTPTTTLSPTEAFSKRSSEVPLDLVNLVPHPFNLYREGDLVHTWPSQGVLRVSSQQGDYSQTLLDSTDGVQVPVRPQLEFDTLEGDPTPGYGKDLIVSSLVADFLMKNRETYRGQFKGIWVPDADPKYAVRGEKGQIIGVSGLIFFGDLSE